MQRAPVRAVVDTNILVRGILRRRGQSAAVRVFDALVRGDFVALLSDYILDEVRYLVTGDNHLLSLKVVLVSGYRPLQIVSPGDFIRELARA